MGEQTKFRKDKPASQAGLIIDNRHDNHLKEAGLVFPGDYYTEWTTEKNFIEKPKSARPENASVLTTGKGCRSRDLNNKNKPVPVGHGDLYASTTYNEIYIIAHLFNYPLM